MTVSEKVAYLKGLADGLGVKDSTNEGKLMLAVIDVLEAMAYDIEAVDAHAKDLSDSISDINEDMEYLEDLCIGDMDDYDEELDDDSDDADVSCTGCCGSKCSAACVGKEVQHADRTSGRFNLFREPVPVGCLFRENTGVLKAERL